MCAEYYFNKGFVLLNSCVLDKFTHNDGPVYLVILSFHLSLVFSLEICSFFVRSVSLKQQSMIRSYFIKRVRKMV